MNKPVVNCHPQLLDLTPCVLMSMIVDAYRFRLTASMTSILPAHQRNIDKIKEPSKHDIHVSPAYASVFPFDKFEF